MLKALEKSKKASLQYTYFIHLENTQPAFSGESEDPVESPASVSSVSYSPLATVQTHHRIGKGAQRRRNRENEELTIEREKIEILKQVVQADKNEDPDHIFGKQVVAEMHLIADPLEKMQVRRAIMRILYEAQDRCIGWGGGSPAAVRAAHTTAKSHQMTSRSQSSTSPPVHHTHRWPHHIILQPFHITPRRLLLPLHSLVATWECSLKIWMTMISNICIQFYVPTHIQLSESE